MLTAETVSSQKEVEPARPAASGSSRETVLGDGQAGPINAGSATDTRIPAGFRATAARNSSTSMVGANDSGPRISSVTPYSAAALVNPACADCQ